MDTMCDCCGEPTEIEELTPTTSTAGIALLCERCVAHDEGWRGRPWTYRRWLTMQVHRTDDIGALARLSGGYGWYDEGSNALALALMRVGLWDAETSDAMRRSRLEYEIDLRREGSGRIRIT